MANDPARLKINHIRPALIVMDEAQHFSSSTLSVSNYRALFIKHVLDMYAAKTKSRPRLHRQSRQTQGYHYGQ